MEIFTPGSLYYHGDEIRIKSKLSDSGISDECIGLLEFDTSRACSASKLLIERELDKKGLLYRSKSQLVEGFLRGERELFASMSIAEPYPVLVYPSFYGSACCMRTNYRYGYERIRINIWLRRIWQECRFLGVTVKRIEDVDLLPIKQLQFLGTASWDSERKEIDMIPFFVTCVPGYDLDIE